MAAEPRPDYEPPRRPPAAPVTDVRGEPAPAVRRVGGAPHEEATVEIPRGYNLRSDRIRWGPVFAGILTATTTMLLLGLLGLAWGLTVAQPGQPGTPAVPPGAGTGAATRSAISAIIAFFVGGYVAGWSAAAFGRKWGALNGAMVFLAGVPLMLWLAVSGLGAILGGVGSALAVPPGALAAIPGTVPPGMTGAAATQAAAQAAGTATAAAWWTFFGLLVALATAAIGGAVGTRREVTVDLDRDVEINRNRD
jgi:hypothetical protein